MEREEGRAGPRPAAAPAQVDAVVRPRRPARRVPLPADLFSEIPAGIPGAALAHTQHEQVYFRLRHALIVGRLQPGVSLSLRGLANALESGLMPVREAVRRLAAEGAIRVLQNRRLRVPELTPSRAEELMQARLLLEPLCAARALPHIDAERLGRIIAADMRMNTSYPAGDAERYMLENFRFHFEIYRAAPSDVLVPVLEVIWAQFGPFMRAVFPQVGGSGFGDKHLAAVEAIRAGDAAALAQAIRDDIEDGRALLERAVADSVISPP